MFFSDYKEMEGRRWKLNEYLKIELFTQIEEIGRAKQRNMNHIERFSNAFLKILSVS